jgi:Leucine-rich repeat (LRR) protein
MTFPTTNPTKIESCAIFLTRNVVFVSILASILGTTPRVLADDLPSIAKHWADVGATIQIELNGKGQSIIGVQLPYHDAKDRDLLGIGRITTIRNLDIPGNAITDEGVIEFQSLGILRRLDLSGNQGRITSAGFSALCKIYSLEDLRLKYAEIGSTEGLSQLKKLRRLELDGRHVFSETSIRPLTSLRYLSSLTIVGGTITDAGMVELRSIPHLMELDLGSTKIEKNGLRSIGKIDTLRILKFPCNFDIDDSDLEILATVQQLIELEIYSDRITDNSWEKIAKLRNLRKLSINSAAMSGAGLGILGDLPNMEVLELRVRDLSPDVINSIAKLTRLQHLRILSGAFDESRIALLRRTLKSVDVELGPGAEN